jgi:hypothetical protein
MRRRRSRYPSRYNRSERRTGLLLPALAAVAVLAGFVYLVRVADGIEPPQQEVRVDLPTLFERAP